MDYQSGRYWTVWILEYTVRYYSQIVSDNLSGHGWVSCEMVEWNHRLVGAVITTQVLSIISLWELNFEYFNSPKLQITSI